MVNLSCCKRVRGVEDEGNIRATSFRSVVLCCSGWIDSLVKRSENSHVRHVASIRGRLDPTPPRAEPSRENSSLRIIEPSLLRVSLLSVHKCLEWIILLLYIFLRPRQPIERYAPHRRMGTLQWLSHSIALTKEHRGIHMRRVLHPVLLADDPAVIQLLLLEQFHCAVAGY